MKNNCIHSKNQLINMNKLINFNNIELSFFKSFKLESLFFIIDSMNNKTFYSYENFILPEFNTFFFSDLFFIFVLFIIFGISFFNIFKISQNFIKIIITFELLLLFPISLFVYFSFLLNQVDGQVFVFYLLGIIAAETALGLALYVSLKKIYN